MTCIAGFVQDGDVWIGGDSAGTGSDWSLSVRNDEKVFVLDSPAGPWIFGFTSSFRMGQLLHYKLDLAFTANWEENSDLMSNLVGSFIDALRDCLARGGFERTREGVETGGAFLVGHAGRLFHVQEDFQVAEARDGIDACGAGCDAALGAMYATTEWLVPRVRLKRALQISERLCAAVRGPFVTGSLREGLETA